MAANQDTAVQDAVSAFISVNLLGIFKETLAHFPAVFVATKPNVFDKTSEQFAAKGSSTCG